MPEIQSVSWEKYEESYAVCRNNTQTTLRTEMQKVLFIYTLQRSHSNILLIITIKTHSWAGFYKFLLVFDLAIEQTSHVVTVRSSVPPPGSPNGYFLDSLWLLSVTIARPCWDQPSPCSLSLIFPGPSNFVEVTKLKTPDADGFSMENYVYGWNDRRSSRL